MAHVSERNRHEWMAYSTTRSARNKRLGQAERELRKLLRAARRLVQDGQRMLGEDLIDIGRATRTHIDHMRSK